jgi:hypothetical protein
MRRTSLLGGAALGTGILSIGLPNCADAMCPTSPSTCVPGNNQGASPAPMVTSISGTPYCAVNISSYASTRSTYYGCTTSGGTICMNDFKAAMADAGRYFYNETAGSGSSNPTTCNYPYLVSIGAGTFTVPYTGNASVIPLPTESAHSLPPISAGERLVIQGNGSAGSSPTVLETSLDGTFSGNYFSARTIEAAAGTQSVFSHFTVQGIHFDANNPAVSQGSISNTASTFGSLTETITVVSSSGTTSTAATSPTQYLQIGVPVTGLPGFNSPFAGLEAGHTSTSNNSGGQYMRIYDNSSSIPTIEENSNNNQLIYHGVCNRTTNVDTYMVINESSSTTTTASFTCPATGTGTYTYLLGDAPGTLDGEDSATLAWYSSSVAGDASLIACVKAEGGGSDFIDIENGNATGGPGIDIALNDLILTGHARSAFSNTASISIGSSTGSVTIEREPPTFTGQAPCLATASGGIQLQSPTYANTIQNFYATATGDDSLAFFGDSGDGTIATASTVSNTTIHDSFARGVLVVPPTDVYQTYTNVFPYAGSYSGTLCGGSGYGGAAGYNTVLPFTNPPTCPDTANNDITSIWSDCPYSSSTSGTLAFCPVRIDPTQSPPP